MRKKTKKLTPVERLAKLLMHAYTAAYVIDNPHHDGASWDQIKSLARHTPYLKIAEELMRKGVKAPLIEE